MIQTRNTPQRKLVLEILQEKKNHPTADEVYEIAREREPKISRGTVYRNLNLLAEQGEIRKLPMPAGADHFDSITEKHYHFQCRVCGKVFDTALSYKGELNETPAALPGFKTEWHRLILVGLCPVCNKGDNNL